MSSPKPPRSLNLAGGSHHGSPYATSRWPTLTPVAEVAPIMPFEDEVFDSTDEDKRVNEKPKNVASKSSLCAPSTSKEMKSQRPTSAELLVALSERRRSQSAAVIDDMKRKSITSNTSKRKSPETENMDPLRANLQLFSECMNLIRRNQRQLLFNVFLTLLVALILTSMIVFAVFAPPKSQFELTLTPWASFWPLDMRLHFYQLGRPKDSLTLTLGISEPSFTVKPPSYCKCCKNDAPKCDTEQMEHCWCFNWRSHARLYLTALKRIDDANTNCLIIEWRSSSHQHSDVTDCFQISFSEGAYWYAGVLTVDQVWPSNLNAASVPFVPFVINDVQSDAGGFYGIGQPMWVSDNGFMVMPSLDQQFFVNRSNDKVCLRSIDVRTAPLKYLVCAGDDSRTYSVNISTFNQFVTTSYQNSPVPSTKKGPNTDNVIGTAFVSFDAATVSVEDLKKAEERMTSYKFSFGIVYENFDLLNETMATDLVDVIKQAHIDDVVQMVEVSNFLKFYHLQGSAGQKLEDFCIRQSSKDTIGISKWRDDIYACLDFTKREVADWFVRLCADHKMNSVIDYMAFAGGDAGTLPLSPNLNLSISQTNFYSTFYAHTVTSIRKSLFLEVAYNTHDMTGVYLNVAVSPTNVRSMIPLVLSMSMQGYSKIALHLVNYTIPERWPVANTDSLYTWVELAMFFPAFRIPTSVLNWHGFNDIIIRYKPFREQYILEHYRRAEASYMTTGQPIFRPVWWTDYNDYRQSKYVADASKIWANDRQFMIGDDLLVAAFLQVDGVEQMVYLPPGLWRNPETQTTIQGGQTVYIDTFKNVACFERCQGTTASSMPSTMRHSNVESAD